MHFRAMLVVLLVVCMVGCGSKGPLYLPGEKDKQELIE